MPPPPIRRKCLDVYLHDTFVGRIDYTSRHNEMRFTYDANYLRRSDATALSFSLPLQSEAFDSQRTTVFFENLLPPDQVRRKLGPVLRLSRHNIFGFLEMLGGDCAGALSLWPTGTTPSESEECLCLLTEDEADEILRSLKKRPLYVNGVDGYRISGAGAQDKLIVCISNGQLSLPLFGTPSTHIVKPAVRDYPDSVYNEAYAMQLAARLNLAVAKSGLMRIKDEIYYWTERFDRETVDGKICRLHQEDFCQITGTPSELKYENEGGPSFAQCMTAMAEMKIALTDRFAFIDRIIFNYLIGNADAHGKNSAILYRGPYGKSLAPIYDVMCTMIYNNLSRESAMTIGGAKMLDAVTQENFIALAEEINMRPQLILGRLNTMATKILPAAQHLAAEMNTLWPSEVYAKIIRIIEQQRSSILARKSKDDRYE